MGKAQQAADPRRRTVDRVTYFAILADAAERRRFAEAAAAQKRLLDLGVEVRFVGGDERVDDARD